VIHNRILEDLAIDSQHMEVIVTKLPANMQEGWEGLGKSVWERGRPKKARTGWNNIKQEVGGRGGKERPIHRGERCMTKKDFGAQRKTSDKKTDGR